MEKKSILMMFFIFLMMNFDCRAPGGDLTIQLWPITIINSAGMPLIVMDEIIDAFGSKIIGKTLSTVTPNNQYIFQWPSTFLKPNYRKITIWGKPHGAVMTNRIIFGSTPYDVAMVGDIQYNIVPSSTFTIISTENRIRIGNPLDPTHPII